MIFYNNCSISYWFNPIYSIIHISFGLIPAGTQRCINIEIWLNIGHNVVQPYFNVDTTSKLQLWITVDISMLNQRWNMVEASTLTMAEKWLPLQRWNDGRYLNIDDGWKNGCQSDVFMTLKYWFCSVYFTPQSFVE